MAEPIMAEVNISESKETLHESLGFDSSASAVPASERFAEPQSVAEVVAQALPGASGLQGVSFRIKILTHCYMKPFFHRILRYSPR